MLGIVCILFVFVSLCLLWTTRHTAKLRKEWQACPEEEEEKKRLLGDEVKKYVYRGEFFFIFVATLLAFICAELFS